MAKNDNLILYAGAGVLAYFLLKDSFKGLSKGVEGIGTGVSEISQGVGSPFSYLDTTLGSREDIIRSRSNIIKNLYENDQQVGNIIKDTVVSKEKTKENRATITEKKTENRSNKAAYQTEVQQSARQANKSETIQRKTEYGFGGSGFFSKTFLPTTNQAQDRREAAKSVINKGIATVKNLFKKK